MLQIFSRLFGRNRYFFVYYKNLAATLDDFIMNVNKGITLNIDEAERNLEKGLLEILHPGKEHSSNGLLITENGYFITSRHCVDALPKYVRTYEDKIYKVEGVIIRSECDRDYVDLALAKAKIPGEMIALKYKIGLSNDSIGVLSSYSRWGGKVKKTYGFNEKNYSNRFAVIQHSCECVSGDSGGLLVNRNRELIGINHGTMSCGGIDMHTLGVGIYNVLELIIRYRENLKKHHDNA